MESRDLINKFLMKLDHDALSAYDKAAAAVRDQDLQDTLLRFRHEHERHVGDFGEAIRREGGKPPDMSMAPRGVFFEGMTAAEGAMSRAQHQMLCGGREIRRIQVQAGGQ